MEDFGDWMESRIHANFCMIAQLDAQFLPVHEFRAGRAPD
jgi:hypothetical protein